MGGMLTFEAEFYNAVQAGLELSNSVVSAS